MAFIAASQCEDICTQAYCGLARVYQLRGLFEDAEAVYDTALKIEPGNLVTMTVLFRLCRQSGKFEAIVDCLGRYLKRHPDDIQMMLCLASLYYGKAVITSYSIHYTKLYDTTAGIIPSRHLNIFIIFVDTVQYKRCIPITRVQLKYPLGQYHRQIGLVGLSII